MNIITDIFFVNILRLIFVMHWGGVVVKVLG